ncbi:MAG TPA: hypothetical protein EYQ25_03475 [Planctomycetes bacterium]|nr:hypothetical protein [Planctomycetota bacterium]HIL36974.1 hypothetical protein [Planctomycetota bacterium]
MTFSLTLAFCATLLVAPQEPLEMPNQGPRPHRALKAFQPMLGQWVGRGVAYDGPGGSPMEWTATLVVERILDGHGVREQLVVDLGEVLPGGYRSTTFYAFDPQAGHLVSFACDNRKGVSRSVATWTGATLLTATLGENQGKLAIERGTFTFEDGKAHMEVLSMVDTHEGFVMVDGTFEPFGGERRVARDAGTGNSRPRGELAKLTSTLGVSRLEGSIIPEPGKAAVSMSTVERSGLFPGGLALITVVENEPAPGMPVYQEYRMTSWNTMRKCYDILWMDNMGLSGSMQGWLQDKAYVVVDSGTYRGKPYAQRTTTILGPKGPAFITSDRLWGVAPGMRVFEGRYQQIK